ncbi:transposase,undefined [Mycoplasma synoviae GX11-T]|nr:transposase,undefined [Mycoplasmopsis synoviae GX11-T]
MLILTRILEPSSKRSPVEKIKKYWYEFNDSLKDVYRSLEFLQDKKVEILNYLNEQFVEKINRNLTFCFLWCNNCLFWKFFTGRT